MGDEGLQSRFGSVTSSVLAAASKDPSNQFGKYVKVAPLGSGQIADVWLAYDTVLHREVALKILSRASDEDRGRLMREAQAATVLSHPNIVAVYEAGRANGVDFIAMEYVRGVPLSRTGVSIPDAARLVREAAAAVHQAHGQGVLHRDLKPSNLLLDEDRRMRVSDFGLARSTDIDGRLVTGTPAYLAPEEARGSAGASDERVDVYALGATLYELVAGEPPFRGATDGDVLRRVLREKLEPPRKVEPRVPVELEAVILKAMARDPARRYASAGDLAEDLRRFLDREPISARPGRGKLLWVAGGAAAVAIGVAVAWVVLPRVGGGGGAGGDGGGPPADDGSGLREILNQAYTARKSGTRTAYLDYLKQAIERADETLKAKPDHPGALLARAQARSDRAFARGTYDPGAKEDVDRLLATRPASAAAIHGLRARIAWAEFERRKGGGLGVHFALRPAEATETTGFGVLLRTRGELPSMRRAMQSLHDELKADLSAAAQSPEHADFAKALGEFLSGSFAEAERAAKRATDADPTDDAAWALLLTVLESSGAYPRGAQTADEGLRRLSRNPTLLAHRAACQYAQQRLTDADHSADEAVKQEPDHATAQALRTLLRSLRSETRPTDDVTKAVTRAGMDSAALRWARSMVLRLAGGGKLDDALDDLKWLVEQVPSPLFLYERGGAYRRKGDWSRAAEDLDRAYREMPELELAALELAELREIQGDAPGALAAFRELATRAKEPSLRIAALAHVTYILLAREDAAGAVDAQVAACRVVPGDTRRWAETARFAMIEGDDDLFLQVSLTWERADGNSAAAKAFVAQAHARKKDLDKAMEALGRAEKLNLPRGDLLAIRSSFHEDAKEWAKALADSEAAIELQPNNGDVRLRAIRMSLRLKQWEKAETIAAALIPGLRQASPDSRALAHVLHAAAAAGRADAEAAMARLQEAKDIGAFPAEWLAEWEGEDGPFAALRDRAEYRDFVEATRKREEEEKAGRVGKPFMGIQMQNPAGGVAGVVVSATIRGTGARRAGLRPGDRVLKINDAGVSTLQELSEKIRACRVGDKVRLRVERGDRATSFSFERTVTIGPRPADK
jgi:tetratricopeptide (TPR) repeat protein/predicted Ser/Thr protein kinase